MEIKIFLYYVKRSLKNQKSMILGKLEFNEYMKEKFKINITMYYGQIEIT